MRKTANASWNDDFEFQINYNSNPIVVGMHFTTRTHFHIVCVCQCFTSFSFCFIYFDQSNLISFINKASCFCLFKCLCRLDCAHFTKKERWYLNKAHRPTQDKGMKKIIITIIIIIAIVTRVVKQTQTHRNRIVQWPIKLEIRCCCFHYMRCYLCMRRVYLMNASIFFALYLSVYASFFLSALVAVPFHCYK